MKDESKFSAPTLIGPGSFYVTGEDNLRVVIRNSLASAVVTIAGRFLSIGGIVTPFIHTIVPASDRSAVTTDFRLGDGWILNVSARVTSGAPMIGQVYVRMLVARGQSAAAITIGTLAQGYATAADDLAWPGSPIRSSVDGPGWLRSIAVPDVATDADFSVPVPTGARWRPLAFYFRFSTDVAGGNRETGLVLTDGTRTYANVPSGVNQAAGAVVAYSFFDTCPRGAGATSTARIAPLPRVDMPAGHTIGSVTSGIAAGDQFVNITLYVEEWIEG